MSYILVIKLDIYLISFPVLHNKRIPVTMAWHILWLQMEEWPPVWRVLANIMNKQSQTVVLQLWGWTRC
jgi:hypothetical protein